MRFIHFKISSILFFALLSFVLSSCDKSIESVSKEADDDYKSLSELFQKMEMIQVTHQNKPVNLELQDLTGRKVHLSDLKGKIIFLNFWATWCPPCRSEMPSMEKLHQKLKNEQFAIVAVSLNEPASKVRSFFKEYELSFMALLDSNGDIAAQFGIQSVPTTLILDKDGVIIGGAIGGRDWYSKKSIALFERLIEM